MHLKFLPALLLLSCTSGLFAQTFSGALESGAGWWLNSDELLPLPQTFEGTVEGKIGNPEEPAGQYRALVRTSFDPITAASTVALREAWVTAFLGPFDLTLGNQLVTWGVTDVFTPCDVVNPQDRSLPVDAEKTPVPMGRLLFNGEGFSLDAVVLPFWIASVPTGLVVTGQSVADNKPRFTAENVQYGGHLKGTLNWQQGFDLGLTVFQGRNTLPTATRTVTPVSPGKVTVTVTKDYDPFTLVGADAVLALEGGLLMKTEGSYRWVTGADTAEGVVGLEYNLFGVKTLGEYIVDWSQDLTSVEEFIHTFVLVGSFDPDSRLSLKAVGAWNLDQSGLVSPQMTYTVADGLKAELKGFMFVGASTTRYGTWSDNALGELTVRYAF